jgi:hypothetical protein
MGGLKKSFESTEYKIYIFKISYIDYNSESLPSDDVGWSFAPFIYKRKEFESEKELRALVFFRSTEENIQHYTNINGLEAKVNLDTLIENIYSSPNSTQWFLDLVNKILIRYKLHKRIEKSKLSERPD